jgi:hypothetical protein
VERLELLSLIIAITLVCSILASGCTGEKVPPQPPASPVTIPTGRPTTMVPETPTPAPTETTATPITPVTPDWTPGIVSQGGAAILVQGDVIGLRSAQGNFIDELRFTIVRSYRAEPVTFAIPDTQIIFTKFGREFGTNYLILSGDENVNQILDEGETFVVRVLIPPPHEVYPGQEFTMAIKNPPRPQITVTTEAPPVLRDRQVLARAPS